jgi:glycine/D-amino acid oxidase-like deaminating enzyme
MRVLICGGGVIGASIAYFLSCRGAEVVVIERTEVACAASGKSGGSWHSIGAMARLSRLWSGTASRCTPVCRTGSAATGATGA